MFQKQIYGFGNKINHKYGFTKNHVVSMFLVFSSFFFRISDENFVIFRQNEFGYFFIVLTFDVKLCFWWRHADFILSLACNCCSIKIAHDIFYFQYRLLLSFQLLIVDFPSKRTDWWICISITENFYCVSFSVW